MNGGRADGAVRRHQGSLIGNSLTDFNNLLSMFQNLSLHLPQPVDVQYRAVMSAAPGAI